MAERREGKKDLFIGELNRQLERELLDVKGSDQMETLVNSAMNYALLREAALTAKGRAAEEPDPSIRETFNRLLEDRAVQAPT